MTIIFLFSVHGGALQHCVDQHSRRVKAVEIKRQTEVPEFYVTQPPETPFGGSSAHLGIKIRPMISCTTGAIEDEFMEVGVSHNGGYYNR